MGLSCKIGYILSCSVVKIESLPLHSSLLVNIVGKNGVGRSVLYRTLIGDTPQFSGSVPCEVTSNVAIVSDYTDISSDVLFGGLLDLVDCEKLVRAKSQFQKITKAVYSLASRKIVLLGPGQKRIAQVFIVLADDRRIIVMDEACACLDYKNKSVIFEELVDIINGGTMALCTTYGFGDICWLESSIYFFSNKVLCRYDGERTTQGMGSVLEMEENCS